MPLACASNDAGPAHLTILNGGTIEVVGVEQEAGSPQSMANGKRNL